MPTVRTPKVRIPQITSIKCAVEKYYKCNVLSSKDMKELFTKASKTTIANLKNLAKEEMRNNDIPVWNTTLVDTTTAYKAWGLDIDDLEAKLKKSQKLGLEETNG
jgi:predicted kinase